MKYFNRNNSGQSLVETVFAIGILMMVVSAILALAAANTLGQKESEFQIVANNLARENIEVVRNIRDSNWLTGGKKAWDDGLTDALGGNQAIALFDPASNSWSLNFNYLDDALYNSPDGTYSHDATKKQSIYHRHLILDNICRDANGQELIKFPCGSGEDKVGIKIMSTVQWNERGRDRKVTIDDLIYEWK
ncbi:MAG: hypothetical protein PHW95_03020 [Patescibacteria group bacterium]|nr:hypothetical protein [Patescibacteria group bacterium]